MTLQLINIHKCQANNIAVGKRANNGASIILSKSEETNQMQSR